MVIEMAAVVTPQDLRAALKALFAREGLSYDTVVARVDDAGGHLGKTTLSNLMTGVTGLPRWETVQRIVTACRVSGAELEAWKRAYRRASEEGVGQPLTADLDPFDLGVHKAITTDEGQRGTLTHYVPRPHDGALAEIVAAADAGDSRFVVLLGDSSTGKTRALWEALAPLRERGGWRLWHPRTPNRRTALDDVDRVRPRAVVWLNETQEYLGGDNRPGDEDAAAALRELLTDRRRAPVLVVGTLWRAFYTALCRPHASQVRDLLENSATTTVIQVPVSFTDAAPDSLAAAEFDARFAFARERAEDGRITQYLAGAPELLRRYEREFSTAARAIVQVAMDARRMGHRNALPHGLLADAAHAYMTGLEWNTVAADGDWLEKALAEAARPCKGADGALARIIDPPITPRTRAAQAGARSGPTYLLADYLYQRSRTARADVIPPIAFWTALTSHAHVQDRTRLGNAACGRGLYRDAAQMWADAIADGDPSSALDLVRLMSRLHPNDRRPADWVIERVADDENTVSSLLYVFREAGFHDLASVLAERAVLIANIDRPGSVAWLLEALREADFHDLARMFATQAVLIANIDRPGSVAWLLEALREAGFHDLARVLAERAVPTTTIDQPVSVAWLVHALRRADLHDLTPGLVQRAMPAITIGTRSEFREALAALLELGRPDLEKTLSNQLRAPVQIDLLMTPPAGEYRFGRESDGAAAGEWTWDDLVVL
ncbi:ATP-binding protein (plasmid) [Nocardia sp. NBC_01377]